jgi:hypothetical protein
MRLISKLFGRELTLTPLQLGMYLTCLVGTGFDNHLEQTQRVLEAVSEARSHSEVRCNNRTRPKWTQGSARG